MLFLVLAGLPVAAQAPAAAPPPPPPPPPAALADLPAPPATPCDEFRSRTPCAIYIDMSPVASTKDPLHNRPAAPTHADVMTHVGGVAIVILQYGSPFLACSLAGSPSVPERDLGTPFASLLQSLGTLVIPGTFQALAAPPVRSARAPSVSDLLALEDTAFKDLATVSQELRDTLLVHWLYSFPDETTAETHINALKGDLNNINGRLRADIPKVTAITAIAKSLTAGIDASPDLNQAATRATLLDGLTADLLKKMAQLSDFLNGIRKPYTDYQIQLSAFSQKKVTEVITCKDAVSGTQPFDAITFTAYYENTPKFDLSAGALVSFLHGRQVGVISGPVGPLNPTTTFPSNCGPANMPDACLGETSRSTVQFMPAAFLEYHPWNFRLPWAGNTAIGNADNRHPLGYLGSFGFAGGFAVNPNNGSTNAEFFEGVSIGIQRVSLLLGLHNGRKQVFADGYYDGEAVPAGTTPRTNRIWKYGLAIGLSYRIALR